MDAGDSALAATGWLLGFPGVYPPMKEGDLFVGPGLIAGHRTVFQSSQNGV